MMTRRTVLGAGLAFSAGACTPVFSAEDRAARHCREVRAIDALLVDETIEIPSHMSTLIKARGQTLPAIGIRLDAASHAGLIGVLNRSRAIVGISSGATLFCLERMAWDQGLRLTERNQLGASDSGDDPCWRDVAALLGGAQALAASPSPGVCDYRPSRVDGTLHVWTMQRKYAGPQSNHDRLDAQA